MLNASFDLIFGDIDTIFNTTIMPDIAVILPLIRNPREFNVNLIIVMPLMFEMRLPRTNIEILTK